MRYIAAFALPVLLALCPTAQATVRADDSNAMLSRDAFAAVAGRQYAGVAITAADAADIRPLAMGGSMDGHRFAAGGISGVRAGAAGRIGDVEIKPTSISRLPEPATWAMMVVGFGLAGWALRRHLRASERRFTERMRRIAEGNEG